MPNTLSSPLLPDQAAKASYVQRMFNRIAPTYDLLNDCISMGMHRRWKQQACRLLQLKPGSSVLDVCTGTGDLVGLLARQVGSQGKVVGLDFSDEMLSIACKRFAQISQANFQPGDAMALPFTENQFEGAIISFGLRNVIDVQKTLSEMVRVVKPGGWIVNLDTCPTPKLPGYWFYFSQVMPRIGKFLSMDPTAYQYLSHSTQSFLTPTALQQCFQALGLEHVKSQTLAFGAVSLQAGQKPAS
jgi:demethylmenaquinone methyltransferase / 2-methoxy-6-polyprenyl-1,4-benzoquinol methylase